MNRNLKGEIVKKFGSQFGFANKIGWHEASVSRVIRGHHILDADTKKKWADILGVGVDEIFSEVAK